MFFKFRFPTHKISPLPDHSSPFSLEDIFCLDLRSLKFHQSCVLRLECMEQYRALQAAERSFANKKMMFCCWSTPGRHQGEE